MFSKNSSFFSVFLIYYIYYIFFSKIVEYVAPILEILIFEL